MATITTVPDSDLAEQPAWDVNRAATGDLVCRDGEFLAGLIEIALALRLKTG